MDRRVLPRSAMADTCKGEASAKRLSGAALHQFHDEV